MQSLRHIAYKYALSNPLNHAQSPRFFQAFICAGKHGVFAELIAYSKTRSSASTNNPIEMTLFKRRVDPKETLKEF